MKMINRKKIRFCALLGLSLFLVFKIITIDRPFSSVSFYKDGNRSEILKSALVYNSKNPDIYFQLANRNDILLLSDETEINSFLLNTIKYNPLNVFALIKLSDSAYETGNKDLSFELLLQANKFSKFSADRLWELSFIAYKLGDIELFNNSLKTITQIDDNRREHVYKLALKLIENREEILKNIISERSYKNYFRYVFSRMYDLPNSKIIYNYFKSNEIEIDKDTKLEYMDFLVSKGDTKVANEIWSSLYGKNDMIVWNGGFENEILNEGLAWKIDKSYDLNSETITEFETQNPLSENRSLKLKFLNKNSDYRNISQTVLVKPETDYIFSSIVSTKDITTNSGVGWELRCSYGGNLYLQTDYLTGTNNEKVLFKKFTTPENCNSLKINLRRAKSNKFDKFISGEILVDDVFLRQAG